jgi:cell cycle sensor histidine kinase DivJ
MTVQSKIDEGTTVTVMLPLQFQPPIVKPPSNIALLTPGQRLLDHDQIRDQAPTRDHDRAKVHQVKKSA